MGLSKYNQKRNFENTPEPKGVSAKKNSKLTFVVQRHYASHLHYDFRLELEGVLKSWAVPKGPSLNPKDKRLAVMVEDHPLPYGKFYGEIPAGNYGAGQVEIWDNGTYKPIIETDEAEKSLLKQFENGDMKILLSGKHLKGAFALVRMNDGKDKNWLLIKKKDEFATDGYDIAKIDSLKSKLKPKTKIAEKKKAVGKKVVVTPKSTQKDIHTKLSFPKTVPKPMLAKLSKTTIDKKSWIYEMKYDGYRVISMINKQKASLFSRNANSFTKDFQRISDELKIIQDSVVLDGEVVIENEKGVSDFQKLQNYKTTQKGTLKYYVFDILYLNGFDVSGFPLIKRKELLKSLFENYQFKNIHLSEFQLGEGKKLFNKLSKKGYEGVIAKDPESIYLEGKRSDSWLKIKTSMMQEAIICGYTEPQNSRKFFGSVILGIYQGKNLKYIGKCGTGFTDASLKELHTSLSKIKVSACPFDEKPKMNIPSKHIQWVEPQLVCNVKFLEWTKDEHMRNPVFMGLRYDKESSEVINESIDEMKSSKSDKSNEKQLTITGNKAKLTNLDKIYFPKSGYTKGDLIAYYQSISKYILPYLKNRPQSLNRHPDGINGKSFYQKDMNVTQIPSWVKTAEIHSESTKSMIDYLICNNVSTLLYMANLGCIELNPWHSTYLKQDMPTYMMLDLDPGKISFLEVVNTALVIKEICDEIQIPCYCKTSGKSGLHVFIPLSNKYDYDQVKVFAEILASLVHQRLPDTTSLERTVSKRKDKIYLDFLQNRKGQTIAAPYCVRPREFATVSAPLMWKEVNHELSPEMFTIANMAKRLEKMGDLWKPVLQKGINLKKVLKSIEKL